MRATVAAARVALGDATVEQALSARAPLLRRALRGLKPRLDDAGKSASLRASGELLASLPNVIVRRRVVLNAWGALLTAFAERGLSIAVPSVHAIDLDSLACLRPALAAARAMGRTIEVAIGEGDSAPRSALRGRVALAELAALRALGRVSDDVMARGAPLVARDPLDDARDEVISIDAMELSLDALGFDRALAIAEALLADPKLTGAALRRASFVAGLAMLNLDPFDRDVTDARAIDAHFAAAMDGESDSLRLAHAAYRRCVTHVRNLREPQAALEHGERAVAEAFRSDDPRAPFFEAWALNGRAFARARSGDLDGARTDCERARSLLEDDGLERVVPSLEVRVARVLIANNTGHIARARGDRAAIAKSYAQTRAFIEAMPEVERPTPEWLAPPDEEALLEPLRAHWSAALLSAEARFDPYAQAASAFPLATILFKQGDAAGAQRCFEVALRLARAFDEGAETSFAYALNLAVAAYRAGDLVAARACFEALARDPFADAGARAELEGAIAMVLAASGDASARARAHAAVVAVGLMDDEGALGRVLRSEGEALAHLGLEHEAIVALDRGLALTALAPEDRFGLLITRLEIAMTPSLLADAIAISSEAVADANAWWDVPRLLRLVERAGVTPTPALDAALDVASQRIDGRDVAERLRGALRHRLR
jgi:tetratricopeptide (TPR) repeat protein